MKTENKKDKKRQPTIPGQASARLTGHIMHADLRWIICICLLPRDGDNLHLGHVLGHESLFGFVAAITANAHHEWHELHDRTNRNGAVLGLGDGLGIKGSLAVNVLDASLWNKGRTIALGHGIAIGGAPIGSEYVKDHSFARSAVWASNFSGLADLDKVDAVSLHNRHVVGLVDGNSNATVDVSGNTVESILALNGPHGGDARMALAVEAHPRSRVELALDLAAFALESQFLRHLAYGVIG